MQKNSVNSATLVGRVGQDPEVKFTTSGLAVVNLSVATTESRKDKEDLTEWSRVVLFGKTAEFVGEYIKKGALVYVEGRLQTRSWENKDGVKVYTTEVVANKLTSLGSKADSGTSGVKSASAAGGAPAGTSDKDDEPLPF